MSAFEGRKSGPHDLVDEEEVAGDDGAGVDHLPLDVEVVEEAEVDRVDHFPARDVQADRTDGIVGLAQQLDDDLLRVEAWKGILNSLSFTFVYSFC